MDSSNNVSNLHVLGAVGQAAKDAAMASCEDTTAILQTIDGTNIANMAQTERLKIALNKNMDNQAFSIRDAVERNGYDGEKSTEAASTSLQLTVDRNGSDNLASTERNSQNTNTILARESGEIETGIETVANETRDMLQTNNTAAVITGNDQLIQYCDETCKLKEQASVIVNATELDVQEMESALALQSLKDAASIELEAFKTQAQFAVEAEACCCELKVEVAKTEYETQKEARKLDSIRIRGELSNAYTEILINKFKCKKSPPKCPCP
jgi:hypothetical protein